MRPVYLLLSSEYLIWINVSLVGVFMGCGINCASISSILVGSMGRNILVQIQSALPESGQLNSNV
jgi:hypothetical protein